MPNYSQRHETATSNVLAWRPHNANLGPAVDEDAGADADEPPDHPLPLSPVTSRFPKAVVRRGNEHQHQSLLTKALQSPSEDEAADHTLDLSASRRRRSLTSNISVASTAELTSDTGVTSPARTSSPSPRLPTGAFATPTANPVDIHKVNSILASLPKPEGALRHLAEQQQGAVQGSGSAPAPAVEKKRCISFACAAKPVRTDTAPIIQTVKLEQKPEPDAAPKRPCIKFACPTRPTANAAPSKPQNNQETTPKSAIQRRSNESSPVSARKHRSPSAGRRGGRSLTPRRASQPSQQARSKRFLFGENLDLQTESSRFHEFATDEPQEDDWIRQDKNATRRKLTIDDTLKMELEIRRLGKEAEEEAEQEENDDVEVEEDEALNEDENEEEDDEEDDDDEDGDDDDDASGYSSDDDGSDGYNTDNEVGFASSDDEDDDLILWTTRQPGQLSLSGATAMERRPSMGEHSDSSSYSGRAPRQDRPKNRELSKVIRSGTPELPDSTDFVCGTLDEDRPLEEAYLSCLAARKREKLRVIPQDIDPSFPTSDPEDEADEDTYKAAHDSDEQLWLHGEIEDLDHEHHERADRRKKKSESPKRYRSPPPKVRGRSPRRLFERHSPTKRWRSPAPRQKITSPAATPVQHGRGIAFQALAPRPNITHTKSLPRPGAGFTNMKHRRNRANVVNNKDKHIRGAIDIVKGLEQKRQRRKEKFHQKYCNRARKGQVPEKRPQPGKGAERMKELGLIMAGKIGPGNYVLSI